MRPALSVWITGLVVGAGLALKASDHAVQAETGVPGEQGFGSEMSEKSTLRDGHFLNVFSRLRAINIPLVHL
jgi:hypothetical protein